MGYVINNQAMEWSRPLLEQWQQLHADFDALWDGKDGTFWKNERAQISVLAGAVWKLGGMALEEFESEKVWKGETSSGRTDMYMHLDDIDRLVEAKVHWPNLLTKQDFHHDILKIHESAIDDIRATLAGSELCSKGLAITFIGPHANPDEDVKANIEEYRNLLASMEFDAIAWYESKQRFISKRGHSYDQVYLVASQVT